MRTNPVLLLSLAACGGAHPAGAPTYAVDVAPIVFAHCTPCHRDGEPVPFVLQTYEQAKKHADQIADVTGQHVMPPWLPTFGEFEGERRLAPKQIATLQAWAAAGAPRGDPAQEPAPPRFAAGWQFGEPDLVVAPAGDIHVPASGPNVFRNYVIPVAIDALRFVDAVEIRCDSPAVHHAVLAVDRTRESRRLDALDPEPGFEGMVPGNSEPPDGHFLGWTPGKRVRREAAGMAWRLWPGNDLVLQLHLTPTGKPQIVHPRIGLWFTNVPTAVVTYPLVLFSDDIDLPPGTRDFVLRDHLTLPVDCVLHSVYPHAHYVCRSMRATVTPPGGAERDLFRIDAWDFDWQDDYRLRAPIALAAGTRIAFEYHYDNSDQNPNNPSHPPVHVRFGQQSSDEMGTLTLQLQVADLPARRRLAESSLRADLEKLGYDARLLLQLTGLVRESGRLDEAFACVERVRAREPEHGGMLFELGMCLEVAGRLDEAQAAYEHALRVDPGENRARMQLGGLVARRGDPARAIGLLEAAAAANPGVASLHNNLATAYFAVDDLPAAERNYRLAVQLDDRHFGAWFNLGRVLAALGRRDEASDALRHASALRPGDRGVEDELRALGQ
ncbi:MAG: tetratricopeptide repeat protein [Planctomycetota bacterium]